MGKEVRTRFAPSPTGFMHVGNLRTALFSYLIARQQGGSFILRIEDTDVERFVEGAVELIYSSLKKAGLNWDEGPDVGGNFGPYVQSERMKTFKKYAIELIEKKAAYRCFCTKERLEKVRNFQKLNNMVPKYDGHCRNLSTSEIEEKLAANEPYVIRQKIPKDGSTVFTDLVFGEISVSNSDLEDQVLIKTDGMPTYNFANVIDDHLMEISHVVRGSEYLSSTPKYNLLYDAFGWEKPQYVHCSPVMKNSSEKLSKRSGDATFEELIEKGYLPQAVVNYIVLLGWSSKSEREIFNLSELVEAFSISGISKSPAIFDLKKLTAMNAQYIRNLTDSEFIELITPIVKKACSRKIDLNLLAEILKVRVEVLGEIAEQIDFIDCLPEFDVDLFVNRKMKTTLESSLEVLKRTLEKLSGASNWSVDFVHGKMLEIVEEMGVKNGVVLWPLRVAVSGKQRTPGGGVELAVLLGEEETLARIKSSIKKLEEAM